MKWTFVGWSFLFIHLCSLVLCSRLDVIFLVELLWDETVLDGASVHTVCSLVLRSRLDVFLWNFFRMKLL